MSRSAAAFAIGPADAHALRWVRAALADAGLCPLSDSVEVLVAKATDGTALGAIGLERYGAEGLLRSLVVAPAARARGVGTALLAALECEARRGSIVILYLLTETAGPFFTTRGYELIAREEVPPAVAASEQFRLHCPASALCLRKRL